ncbi:unnamed protein product (macronuclear) [Paramecium tetraurelia]|uniref:2-oxoacid dehydrogenase acyltransferase catalytic domain-containing protein n=1 Tax=Paramecium tetraurelia TaxID=5888 RepID=A0C618_PARTE|nr:uncharacterized protein GSPATT00035364001 [Paramecium tetraurelia]CAK66235.1 unnamed protein product [Paramecium tetraurelia]|eukprot:XP_001433632.1 hypothetical protein (macronuclear) [Paramecium tetraurelia strain d4-2]
MTIVNNAFIASVLIYSFLYDTRLLYIFLGIIAVYQALSYLCYPNVGYGSGRRRLSQALWSAPTEGIIYNLVEIDLTNTMKYLQSKQAKDSRVTLTHICIRAVAECISATRKKICGKIVFGKFVEFPTIDVSCLVNIGEGDDLAALLVQNADKKTFEDIAEYINGKAKMTKQGKDEEHQQRSGMLRFFPPFVIALLIQITSFLTYNLGITIKALGLKKDCFGIATVTSIGTLGFKNAIAPFTPMMRNLLMVTVNQIVEKTLVKDGQIVITPTFQLNFCADHRFLDGGAIVKSNKVLYEVFENPEKYARK